MVRKNALKIRSWFFILGEGGVTTERSCFFVLYFGHVNSITRNTQLLYMLLCSYWISTIISTSDIHEVFP